LENKVKINCRNDIETRKKRRCRWRFKCVSHF